MSLEAQTDHLRRILALEMSLEAQTDISLLEHIISNLASSEISIIQLVSVAHETGLSHDLSETPEDRFSRDRAQIITMIKKLKRMSLSSYAWCSISLKNTPTGLDKQKFSA